jgi:hypothetical protein
LLGLLLSSCAPADKTEAETPEPDAPAAPELRTPQPAALLAPNENIDLDEYGTGAIRITDAGVYELTGTLTDGGILIMSDGVTLILDDVNISCTYSPAITCENGNLTIELRGKNYLTSNENAVQAMNNLTINGSGSVSISATKIALQAAKTLTINNGNITVTSVLNAIESENVLITKGNVNLLAAENGIIGGSALDISGGEITVSAGVYSLRSNGTLTVSGGKIIAVHSDTNSETFYLDGKIDLTGGTIIADGSIPDLSDTSTQSFIALTGITAAGTEIEVYPTGETPNGDHLLATSTAESGNDALIISAPGIVHGRSYDVYINGEFSAVYRL